MKPQVPQQLEPKVVSYLGQYRDIRVLRQQLGQTRQESVKRERKEKATRAREKVQDVKTNFVRDRGEQLRAITDGITRDIQEQTEREDQIHRKRLIGSTKDKGYTDDVETPVKELLQEVQEALNASPVDAAANEGLINKIDTMIEQLKVPILHYGSDVVKDKRDGKKDTDPVQVQRLAKIEAIKQRQEDLRQLKAKLQSILDEQAAYAFELAQDAYKGIAEEEDANAQRDLVNAFQKGLAKSSPTARREFLSGLTDQDEVKLLLKGANNVDVKLLDDFVAVHGQDEGFMRSLTESMLDDTLKEGGQQQSGTYLRANETSILLTARYHRASPGGKALIGNTLGNTFLRVKGDSRDNTLDKDTADPQHEKYLGDQEVARRTTYQKNLVRQALDEITHSEVPDDVARFCAKIYDDYLAKFPNDLAGAYKMVGGHVMLRLVTPVLFDAGSKGDLPNEQSETLRLQSKILQNISNNVDPRNEPHMALFSDLIKKPENQGGGPSDEVVKLQQFFENIVNKGRALM